MAQKYYGSMVQWLDGDNNMDEDKDEDDNDDLVSWHNNQPCGRMHSCQRGEWGVFNDDKYKDGEDKDDNKLQQQQWTATTNDYDKLQWPTTTTDANNQQQHDNDQQRHDNDQQRQRSIPCTMQQSTSQLQTTKAAN